MRIGMMLRSLDEKGGVGIYTRYLVQELLTIDRANDYILYYRSPVNLGRFAHHVNVAERVVGAPNKAFWDQLAIPYACWRDDIDVVFHPKFTIPLLAPCKTVMVVHGADWFIPEHAQFYKPLDRAYMHAMMPLYCRRASAILSVSQLCTESFNRIFALPPGKIRTVYFGPGKHFKRIEDPETLERVRTKYALPEPFILTLSGYDRGRRKNIKGTLKAFELHHGKSPHALVIGGRDCDRFREDYGIPDDGYGKDLVFPGWIEQEDLPALYSLADCFLYPSNVEAFPIPLTEAMACGTPIITSSVNGLKEIAGDAAFFVRPDDPREIADALGQVLSDRTLRQRLSAHGLVRSRQFSWEKCARETVAILERAAQGERPVVTPS